MFIVQATGSSHLFTLLSSLTFFLVSEFDCGLAKWNSIWKYLLEQTRQLILLWQYHCEKEQTLYNLYLQIIVLKNDLKSLTNQIEAGLHNLHQVSMLLTSFHFLCSVVTLWKFEVLPNVCKESLECTSEENTRKVLLCIGFALAIRH